MSTDERHERDQTLLRRIRLGDTRALDELLRAYTQPLFVAASHIVHTPDLAQDVVQDVFVWLWMHRADANIKGSVAAYLLRAVRNRAQNVVRHERSQHNLQERTRASYDGDEPSVSHTGEAAMRNVELHAAVDAALATLPPRAREVFLMRVEQEFDYADIATALGIEVTSVHKQMYRATKMLAERLAEWRQEDGE